MSALTETDMGGAERRDERVTSRVPGRTVELLGRVRASMARQSPGVRVSLSDALVRCVDVAARVLLEDVGPPRVQ